MNLPRNHAKSGKYQNSKAQDIHLLGYFDKGVAKLIWPYSNDNMTYKFTIDLLQQSKEICQF